VVDHVSHKGGSGATRKPKQQIMLAHHHYEASSPAQHNRSLSLLNAGQLSHQISSKSSVNHSTVSMLPLKFFLHWYKISGDHPSELSAVDTHHAQQLISSWKAGNTAQVCKALMDIKNKPPTSYLNHLRLR